MPDKGGLQLLPESRKKIEVRVPGENRLVTVGAVVLVLALGALGYLYWYTGTVQARLKSTDAKLTQLEQTRDKNAEQKILALNRQFALLSDLLTGHIYWSQAFAKIEGLIQPQVRLTGLQGNLKGDTVTFQAEGASYTVVARQLAVLLNDPVIDNVEITKISLNKEGRVAFSITMGFVKDKFFTLQPTNE